MPVSRFAVVGEHERIGQLVVLVEYLAVVVRQDVVAFRGELELVLRVCERERGVGFGSGYESRRIRFTMS